MSAVTNVFRSKKFKIGYEQQRKISHLEKELKVIGTKLEKNRFSSFEEGVSKSEKLVLETNKQALLKIKDNLTKKISLEKQSLNEMGEGEKKGAGKKRAKDKEKQKKLDLSTKKAEAKKYKQANRASGVKKKSSTKKAKKPEELKLELKISIAESEKVLSESDFSKLSGCKTKLHIAIGALSKSPELKKKNAELIRSAKKQIELLSEKGSEGKRKGSVSTLKKRAEKFVELNEKGVKDLSKDELVDLQKELKGMAKFYGLTGYNVDMEGDAMKDTGLQGAKKEFEESDLGKKYFAIHDELTKAVNAELAKKV